MNIHCMDTWIILLLAVSTATAQLSWSDIFRYHRNDHYDSPAIIEVQHSKIVRMVHDDYAESPRRVHFFEPFDVFPPVIYLPRIHPAPEVYVDNWHPYVHNYPRFQEPQPLHHLWTTVTLSYNARLVRVVDKDEKKVEEDSLPSDSSTVEQAVKKSGNEGNAETVLFPTIKGKTKRVKSADTNGTSGSDKKVTPKPDIKVEASTAKPEASEKPDDNETTESTAKVDAVKESNADGAESQPIEEKEKTVDGDAKSESTTAASDGNSESAPAEKTGDSATDVPAA